MAGEWTRLPPKQSGWVLYREDEDSDAECLNFTSDGLIYRAGQEFPINIKNPIPHGLYYSEPIDMHDGIHKCHIG